jgi:cellulose synthase/poly-beta-1,6-N-acetylglucosamine synthase-like glycosyltransferase
MRKDPFHEGGSWLARRREPIARAAGLCFALYGAYYLIWRMGFTLNLDAPWLSLPLIAAEVAGFLDFLLFLFMTWRIVPSQARAPRPDATVDVFITTYNESPEILRSTILAAVNMRYPHRTYVLDDGRRPAIRQLANALGAEYVTRPDNAHAKAGNINHAMTITSGEFIAVFDADHVPHPQFLERTIAYFDDERVALVQTPQEFYNRDSIQHSADGDDDLRWHEQALFYRVIQPGKDRMNSVFWCGSNALLRRAALESIGGVATETITEDIHTTIKLHAAGWRTRYHNEALAAGIAPDDLDAFLVQRKRWAQGAMQILRSRYNPLWARGLSMPQRLSYWASMSTYFASFQKLIFIAVPIAVLLTATLPMRTFGLNFLLHFAPYMALGLLANTLLSRGYGHYLDTERFNLLKSFAFMRASLSLVVRRNLKFQVTRKTRLMDDHREMALALPHLVALGITVCAIGWAGRSIVLNDVSPKMQFALELTAIWALYNAGLMTLAVRGVLTRSHRRQQYRFETDIPGSFQEIDITEPRTFEARISDLNPVGLGFRLDRFLAPGQHLRVRIGLPHRAPVQATAVVVNALQAHDEAGWRIGARFAEIDEAARDALTLFLFSDVAMPDPGTPAELRAA